MSYKMGYSVYILYSAEFDKFYYGQTEALDVRISNHNSGKVTSTARYVPWKLYAYKQIETRKEAMSIERKLKNLKSRKRVQHFIKTNEFKIIK